VQNKQIRSDKMSKEALFNNKFDSITNVVEFNPKWINGTGFFDAAVETIGNSEQEIAVSLKPGEMAKCTSPGGRKMIFVGTDLGTCVVYQRYSDTYDTIVVNQAELLAAGGFIKNGELTYAELKRIVGGIYFNEPTIGMTIANIKRCFEMAKAIKSQ
jgi:hypothetical protein